MKQHYSKKAYELGKPEVGKVVKVSAPDSSSTVVGVLHRVDQKLVTEYPDGLYGEAFLVGGSVTLVVGPWRAQVDAHSRVEVEDGTLEPVVLVGELAE